MNIKKIIIFISAIIIFILAVICYLIFSKKSEVKVIDTFDLKKISVTELEEIVGIKFTEDSIEYPEITLKSLNDGGIPFPGDTDTFYAPNTDIKVLYDISIEALKSSECYSENWSSISDQNNFNNNNYICGDINYLEKNYGIETNSIQYINTQYGTCKYDITNGINYADYYIYVYIISVNENTAKIFISGKYPYPIELQ